MFEIGWTELLVIGVVALIVIGPKDLPGMFRTMGRFMAKARGLARDFQRAMESAADETGVKDVAKDLKDATSARSLGLDAVKDAARKFENWDPMKGTKPGAAAAKPAGPPSAATATAAPAAAAAPAVADASPAPTAPMGPNTQALADAQAAKRAAARAAVPKPAAPDAAAAAKDDA
ncbi:MAG TPA: Sec-independent protein translocase protein TatB [Paracoccaceae bacterium]|jgi:sec-independent protein translocase protein TatB|nr:Sec-independent protein translocase protein TatB [Paracoccaceae bacterium]